MERLAFDQTRYLLEDDSFDFSALEYDTSALSVEASTNRPVQKRILRTVEALWQGKVVQGRLNKQTDVLDYFSNETPLNRKESQAGVKMKEVIDFPDGTVFVWLSSPGGDGEYKEGRLRIGIKKTKFGIPVLLTYGIPLVDIRPQDCLYQYYHLDEFSDEPAQKISQAEDLRDKVLRFIPPEDKNWLDFLEGEISSNLVPPEVWQAIKSGDVLRENRRAGQMARAVIASQKATIQRIVQTRQYSKLVSTGADIERQVIEMGYHIRSGVCGRLNSDTNNFQSLGNSTQLLVAEIIDTKNWSYEPGVCRICGHTTEVGPCDICRTCEKEFD